MDLSMKEIILFLGCFLKVVTSQVIELDDSFEFKKGDRPWLVEFYAPWCGHCRKLAPTYHQVSLELKDTEIRVAKVDATKHVGMATDYEVRGYPTIKFIQRDRVFTHKGDRSKEGIIEFAKRAAGPQVRTLSNVGKFNEMRGEHAEGVSFVYIGSADEHGELMTKFRAIAEKYAILGYFYAGEKRILPSEIKIQNEPTVIVIKDGIHMEYEPTPEGPTKASLDDWVNSERFQTFPRISGGTLNEMADLKKKVVMVITNESDKDTAQKQERVKDMVKMLATNHRSKYHKHFQFAWMAEPDTANNIAMTSLSLPSIMVLDMDTQYHYQPDMGASELTVDTLANFLEEVHSEKAPALGGTGIPQRFKRLFYDIWTTIRDIYNESPWLALMVFGIPSVVISIVCYALCCMEPVDEDALWGARRDDSSDEEDEDDVKREQLPGDAETAPKAIEKDDGHMKKD